MKRIIWIFWLLIPFGVVAQQSRDSSWVKQQYIKREVYIPMRDGIKLFTAVYMPRDTVEKHPILFLRSPYSVAPYGRDKYFPGLWNSYFLQYMKERYIVVMQDVRGRYMSEGQFENVRPFIPDKNETGSVDEASDAFDSIEWLLANVPGNNGKVGVLGNSYAGFYAVMAALSDHPALKAVSPQAPVIDWFMGDDVHHNGAFFLLDAFTFFVEHGFGFPAKSQTIQYPKGSVKFTSVNSYESFLQIGAIKNLTRFTGDSIAFWKEIYGHPNLDSFWRARNVREHAGRITPAMLTVGGLFDGENIFGSLSLYKAIEKEKGQDHFNMLVLGPWYHGQWSSNSTGSCFGPLKYGSNTANWYQNNIEVPFFNYYLKGKGTLDYFSEAQVFITGDNRWAKFQAWPPLRSAPKSFYFTEGGRLSGEKPSGSGQATSYVSDPAQPVPYTAISRGRRVREAMVEDQRFLAGRKDVISFVTEPLSHDMTVTGPVMAELFASISGTDADFVVKLIDVYPSNAPPANTSGTECAPFGIKDMKGYQMLIRGEVMRGRYRNSFENPEPFTPEKIERIQFELPDVAHTFKRGHRVMIQIQSSWFPLVDRNPQQFINIYTAEDSDFRKATIRIHHDSQYPSRVHLPVLAK